jgi:hypothetical protein
MSGYIQYDPNQVVTNKDGIPIYGMDLELEAKKMAKYDKEKENDVRFWIEAVTGESFSSDDFQDSLKSGVLLCKLANIVKPGSVPKINSSKLPFMQMENIGYFLKAAEKIGLKSHDAFQTVDLYEGKNIPQVIQTLFIYGSLAQKVPGFNGPQLGIKIADKQEIQFTDEQLRKSNAMVGLQYEGSTKHETGLNSGREIVKSKDTGLRGTTSQQSGGSIAHETGLHSSRDVVKTKDTGVRGVTTQQSGGSIAHETGMNSSREVVKTKDTGVRGITTQQSGGSIAYANQPSISNNIVKVQQSGGGQQQGSDDSTLDDLERLAELRDQGILTDEEFNQKKRQILGL